MSLANSSGIVNTTWVPFTQTWIADKTNPILIFGFDASTSVYITLDDVSVVDTTNSSIELLMNPSFENSTSRPTGCTAWCTSTCGTGSAGNVTSSGCRTSRCYKSGCNNGGIDYLGQAFSAMIGRTYNITFWSQRVRYSASNNLTVVFYAGII